MLEICADTITSCLAAKKGGADRIELCECVAVGGLTPSYGKIKEAREISDMQLNVLIRPRYGNFCYSNEELNTMKHDIEICAKLKCDGVVFGILTKEHQIDMVLNNELVKIARQNNLSCTFHRAFDICDDLFDALEDVIAIGFDRILTSGGEETAMKGINNLKKLVEQAHSRIIVMPGSGVNEKNIRTLIEDVNAKEVHGTFSKRMVDEKIGNNKNFFGDYGLKKQTDWELVQKAKSIMDRHLQPFQRTI